AGMYAHGVEVLNRADDDDVVGEVAHYLKLVLLPAQHALFNQALVDGREVEATREDLHQLFAVVGYAASGAAERKAGPDEHGEPDFAREVEAIAQIVHQRGFRHIEPDADHRILEEQAIFRLLDGPKLGADQIHVVLVENAGVGKINGQIEGSLASHRGQQRELPRAGIGGEHPGFAADDLLDVVAREGFDVRAVGELRIGHDGGRIRVHQHDLVSLGL